MLLGRRQRCAGSHAEQVLGAVVEHEHQRAADAAHDVGEEALVQALGHAFLGGDLLEAIHGALVQVLLDGLLGLHLQAAADGVEGIGGAGANGDGRLRGGEGARRAQNALVGLVRVEAGDGVEAPELQAAVADDAYDRDAEARVKGEESAGALHGLHDAIAKPREALLARADIRGQARPRVVQRVDDAQASGGGQSAGNQVGAEKLRELRLRIVLREHFLEGVLEGEVEGLCGEVADAIREVPVPEAAHALLFVDAGAAVHDALIPGHLAAANLGVGVLRLHHKLDALDGRGDRLGHGAGETAQGEVDEEALEVGLLLGHGFGAVCLGRPVDPRALSVAAGAPEP
mmetsp:Transcript_102921/g.296360  ORF Transcript_102921/g.296360 Transcript_102921/m.296360 type:complete len:345 (-) Transcript_102921:2-1036(-)